MFARAAASLPAFEALFRPSSSSRGVSLVQHVSGSSVHVVCRSVTVEVLE